MKTAMTSVDIAASVLELQRLQGASVDKIHQQSPLEFRLRVGREDLLVEAGRRIHLTRYRRPAGGTHNFPMLLRKHLTGGRLTRVRQAGLDRIVELQVARGEQKATVVVEMLTPPNLLLLDGEGRILRALTHRTYKDRSLRRGEPYRPPPAKPDPRALTPAALQKILGGSSRDLVRTLATDLGLGGLYAEEVCLRAGLDKNLEAPRADPDKIREALRGLLGPLDHGPLRPQVLLQGGEMVDVVPLELESHRGMEARPYPTFQEALDDYFTRLASRPAGDPQAGLRRMLESQEKTAARLETEAREADEMAQRVYAHYPEVERALREKRKQIVLNGDTMELDPRLGVEKNAARLYQRAKEARAKLQGARQAIEETRRRLTVPMPPPADLPQRRVRQKARWYHPYRWFTTTDGLLAVAGRDADDNETLVSRYLEPGDLFFHTATGTRGPVTILKGAGPQPPGASVEEAARFTASFSSSWKAGRGSEEVFWVPPEQVSKTPDPGQSLPKGAFVIRGRKNTLEVPLRIAIGIHIGEETLLLSGPPETLLPHLTCGVVLEPGEVPKEKMARQVREALLSRAAPAHRHAIETLATPDAIARLLPPGGSRMVEVR